MSYTTKTHCFYIQLLTYQTVNEVQYFSFIGGGDILYISFMYSTTMSNQKNKGNVPIQI